jgi:hypothetical protein
MGGMGQQRRTISSSHKQVYGDASEKVALIYFLEKRVLILGETL